LQEIFFYSISPGKKLQGNQNKTIEVKQATADSVSEEIDNKFA
jgi:hypothetical protein